MSLLPFLLLVLLPQASLAAKPSWLPCDPEKLKFKPVITIGAEEEPAEASKPTEVYFLAEGGQARDRKIREAARGDYVLGLQSLYLNEPKQRKRRLKVQDWRKARIFGLEHPFPGALAALMRAFRVVKESDGQSEVTDPKALRARTEFLKALADNPFLREAWKGSRLLAPSIPNAKDEAIAKIFDQVVDNPELDQEKLLKELPKDHAWLDRLAFMDVVAGVERGFASLAEKPKAKKQYSVPAGVPEMMETYFRLNADVVAADSLELAVSRWRSLFVASSVAALICKAAEGSRHIVALVEAGQATELKKLLKESFGPSVKIEDAGSVRSSPGPGPGHAQGGGGGSN